MLGVVIIGYIWLDILPKLIRKYNNKVHRSIGMKPNQVNSENSKHAHNTLAMLNTTKKKSVFSKAKFKLGDAVSISKYKHIFSKSYTPNWTTETFTIAEVKNTKPVTYILKDENGELIKGGFYDKELLNTNYKDMYLVEKVIKKKGDLLYIKWLGFPNSRNSWINVKDVGK